MSRVLLAPGYSLASFASSVMGSVLHRDFTLKNMVTPAVLDAQNEPDSLAHHNECPRLYNIFNSGDVPRYCHKEIFS